MGFGRYYFFILLNPKTLLITVNIAKLKWAIAEFLTNIWRNI